MTKLAKIAIASLLGMAVISTSAFADADKGQKIYSKKLKKACGMDGGKFAKHHTQDEWKEIVQNNKLKDEVQAICKDADISKIKDKHIPNLGDFVIEYASDSGNVPSC